MSIDKLMDAIDCVVADWDNYDDRNVLRDTSGGLTVSTVYTTDCGYETAVLDIQNAHPVERYPTKEEAIIGHAKWLALLPTLSSVTKLGWLGMVEPKEIVLQRA